MNRGRALRMVRRLSPKFLGERRLSPVTRAGTALALLAGGLLLLFLTVTSAPASRLDEAPPTGDPASNMLGLEQYYQYTGVSTGAGTSLLNNDDTGNVVWNYNAFANPSRGFQTFVRVDYNSMDPSESSMGFGWSLQASTLARVGTPLAFSPGPHPATVTLTDGDGTTHTFTWDRRTGTWISPPGLPYYLQQVAGCRRGERDTQSRAWLMTAPDRTQFYFDCQGYQTAIVDNNGNEADFTYSWYDSYGRPVRLLDYITDPSGRRTLTITYYLRGQGFSYIDREGNVAYGRYLDDPAIVGQVKSITDVSGRTIAFLYDAYGRMSRMIDGDGTAIAKVFRFGYGATWGIRSARLVSVTNPRGYTTHLAYYVFPRDLRFAGALESITDPMGRTTSFSYARRRYGDVVTAVTDPKGNVTTYLMDVFGRPLRMTNALHQTTTLGWDEDNNVTSLTEANFARTTWTYDPLTGYPLTMKDAQANHDGTAGYVYRYQTGLYGHTANLTSELTPQGRLWTFGYDARGNVTTVTEPLGNVPGAAPGSYTTRYTYDSLGDLLTSTDPDGNTTKFSGYGPTGYPDKITDPLGHTTTYAYSSTGNVTAVTDPLGNTTTQAYDIFGRPGQQVVPKTSTESIVTPAPAYDGDDNVITSYAANGAATTYTYDADDEMVRQQTAPDTSTSPAPTTTYRYDADGNLVSETTPDGNVPGAKAGSYTTTLGYNAINELTAVTDPAGGVTTVGYDNVGDVTGTTDPNGNTTTYAYDLNHQLIQTTDPSGHTTKIGYDLDGLTTSTTDQNGNTTRYTLDADGDVIQQQVPAQAPGAPVSYDTTRYVYDQDGNQTEVISPRGVASGIPGADTTRTVYNADNEVTAQFSAYNPDDPGFRTPAQTDYSYDADGRLSSVSAPPSGSQKIRNVTDYSYFDNGWIQSSTDPWGITTSYDYNSLGEQSSQTVTSSGGAMSQTMTWDYYPDGNLAAVSDDGVPTGLYSEVAENTEAGIASWTGRWPSTPCKAGCEGYAYQTHRRGTGRDRFTWRLDAPENGNYTVYVRYPAVRGAATNAAFTVAYSGGTATVRVNQAKNAGTWVRLGTWAFTRASANQRVSLAENSRGTVVANAVEIVRDNAGQKNTAVEDYTYSYDADGNQTKITDTMPGAAITSYVMGYDQLDRNTSVDEDDAAGHAIQTTTYGYDGDSNLTAQTHDGVPSAYQYNDLDELVRESDATSASGAGRQVTTFSYTPDGQVAAEVKPNGNAVRSTYYADNQLLAQTENTSGGRLVSSHLYSYDPDGNQTRDVEKLMSASDSSDYLSHTLTYTYDPMDQVETVSTDGKVTESYTHDADGNVTSQTIDGTTTAYDYDLNRLLTATTDGSTADYNYDPLGRLDTVTSGNQVLQTDTYDGFGNLVGYGQFDPSTGKMEETTYTYDPLDRMATETTSAGTASYSYLGLTSELVSESDPGGQSKTYTYTPAGSRIAQNTTTRNGVTTPGYYSYNEHSDVEAVTGASGTTTATYGYTAYGDSIPSMFTGADKDNVNPSATSQPYNSYRYNAMRWDSSSGQYDMGFRNYDPGLNQFLSQDMYDGALADMDLVADPFTGSPYAFGDGNPVSNIELNGHMPCIEGGPCGSVPYLEKYATAEQAAQAAQSLQPKIIFPSNPVQTSQTWQDALHAIVEYYSTYGNSYYGSKFTIILSEVEVQTPEGLVIKTVAYANSGGIPQQLQQLLGEAGVPILQAPDVAGANHAEMAAEELTTNSQEQDEFLGGKLTDVVSAISNNYPCTTYGEACAKAFTEYANYGAGGQGAAEKPSVQITQQDRGAVQGEVIGPETSQEASQIGEFEPAAGPNAIARLFAGLEKLFPSNFLMPAGSGEGGEPGTRPGEPGAGQGEPGGGPEGGEGGAPPE
jgi:RHS repeat-associated protein